MRISGLSSGIDWEGLVEKLMQLERRPLLLMESRKLHLESIKTGWQDVNTRLLNLKTRADTLVSAATFDAKTVTSGDSSVVTAVVTSSATTGSYDIVVSQLAAAHSVASNQYADVDADLNLTGTFQIDSTGGTDPPVSVTVETTDSLAEIRTKINDVNAGVTASIIDGRLVITRSSVGNTAISFTDSSANPGEGVLTELGILNNDDSGFVNELVQPRDASFAINNIQVTRSSNTVDDVVPGVTLYLHAENIQAVRVTVSQDIDSVVSEIEDFVAQYNSAMSFIATQLDKDQNGKLVGDPGLMAIERDLRHIVGDIVPSLAGKDYDRLSAVGITTTVDKTATLEVDDAVLRQALEKDPDTLKSLFTASDGIATRIDKKLDYLTKDDGFIEVKTDSFTDRITDITNQIERMEVRLASREQVIMDKFVRLETLLGTLQTQSSWLDTQLQLLMKNWKALE